MARVNVTHALLSLALLTLGARFGGVFGGLVGLAVAEAAGSVVGAFAIRGESARKGIRRRYRDLRSELPVLWTFSLPALLSSMATLPATWLASVLLVRQPDGYAAMGLFTAANKWSLLILFVPISVANIVLPMLANLRGAGDDAAFRRVFHANVLVSLGCTLVPSVLIAALAAPIMALYGEQYRAGWPILVILALATVPTALNTVLGQAIVSTASIWWRFWFDLLLAVILLGCAWLLIPRWGGDGHGNRLRARLLRHRRRAVLLHPAPLLEQPRCLTAPSSRDQCSHAARRSATRRERSSPATSRSSPSCCCRIARPSRRSSSAQASSR